MAAATVLRVISVNRARKGEAASPLDALYRAIQEDSPGWQKDVFDRHFGLVRGLLVKSLGPRADVDDLLDEVFLRFFKNARRVRAAEGIRSYVVSITMNLVRSEIGRRQRRNVIGRLFGQPEEIDEAPASDDTQAKAALLRMGRILQELPTGDRLALVLRVLEGMQFEEVADALNISVSTAKRRVARATQFVKSRVSRDALLSDYVIERTRGVS
jgi:RNA polymerase sigma-70 factor (ECF subfamily)